jgi:hypothetical protein
MASKKDALIICVAQTAKRRRRQFRQTRIGRNRSMTARKRWDEAKYSSSDKKKKK